MFKVHITLSELPFIDPDHTVCSKLPLAKTPQPMLYRLQPDVCVIIGDTVVSWDFFGPSCAAYLVVQSPKGMIHVPRRYNSLVLIVRGTDDDWYILVVNTERTDHEVSVYNRDLKLCTKITINHEITTFPDLLYRFDNSNPESNKAYRLVYCPESKSVIEHRAEDADRFFELPTTSPWLNIYSTAIAIGDNAAIYYFLYDRTKPNCMYLKIGETLSSEKYNPILKISATMELLQSTIKHYTND